MKKTKSFGYYFKFWLLATILYALYFTYITIQDGFNASVFMSVVYLPLLFTVLMFLFDLAVEKIWPSKKKTEDDQYNEFLKKTTFQVNDELKLSIEDFRRLRENDKFQKSLYQAYQIYLNGETDEMNFVFLGKKFKKDTNEYKALEIVVKEVKKMMVN